MKTKIKQISFFLIISIISISIDQITKAQVVAHIKGKNPIILIHNVLELLYTENRGAAFGIFQGKQIFFFVISAIVICAIIYMVLCIPDSQKYLPLLISMSFIFSGAIGNMIDRIIQGYVVDFIYFKPINFPVFNVADIYVTCSTAALIILFLFYYKEEDLNFFSKEKRNNLAGRN